MKDGISQNHSAALAHLKWALTILYFTVALVGATALCASGVCTSSSADRRWWSDADLADRAGRCAGWAVQSVAAAAGGRGDRAEASPW